VFLSCLQRKDRLFITIKVKDCADADVRLFAEGRLSFKGTVGKKNYAMELDLFGAIKPDNSTIDARTSAISITLIRAEAGDHWPRLTKDSSKNHRIGLDHSRYIDQDDEEEQQQQKDLQKLKDELDSVGKKTEEEEAEDEMAAMMTQAYQVMFYAVVVCGWAFVLLGGAVTWLGGGEPWATVGEIAMFLQLGGWVSSLCCWLRVRARDWRWLSTDADVSCYFPCCVLMLCGLPSLWHAAAVCPVGAGECALRHRVDVSPPHVCAGARAVVHQLGAAAATGTS
jgi:hypothetical protein